MLWIQLACCLLMTGLIWFVQIVHYPLFAKVGVESFVAYEQAHVKRTGWVVMPIMLLELVSAFVLFSSLPLWWNLMNLSLLGGIWLSTFFIQVPLHGSLAQNHSPERIQRLSRSNWIRTALWSLRSLGMLVWVMLGLA